MVAIGGPVQGDNTLPYRSYPDLLKFSFACEGRFPRDASRGTLPECPLEGGKCKAITPYPICHPVPKKCGICLKDPRSHRGLTRWGVGGPGVGLGVMSVRRYDLTLFVTPFHIILVRENQCSPGGVSVAVSTESGQWEGKLPGSARLSRYLICGPCKCKAISPYPICRSGL